ncbi:transcription initiation factor IIB [Natranaeroarchaeum sulfidigenes]|uniref:Transcription initiation factor IIB n=1 Tax=Natranaeroarchaeum sulfidigenes TaxID=2784880 RepID=A0A897MLR9_9EURY|nr:transcription initiation factor IIB family protein [Natranaeroarchaeum sulfidigenes]QSG01312.1 Transcription initiation factor TFIIB, Brf1 subunit/Transcription initiation factor TFIIB [Natranaeroarchaeum sulfidigenes]
MSGSTTANACPECGGGLTVDGDETLCSECGLVVGADRIDRGPEWRTFEDDDRNRKRTGAPLTRSRHDRGLSTEIGSGSRTRLTGRKRRQVARMRREHNRSQISTKVERNQVYAFTEIRRLVSALSLPQSVRDGACSLFRSAQKEDLLRGRSLEGFAAATTYAACRVNGVARTIDEIGAVARADRDEFKAAYGALNRELGLPVGPIDPREYLPRFASELDLDPGLERRARELAGEGCEANVFGGRDPSGVAAGCLYTAARELDDNLTQKEASAVADVSPVTLRSVFQALCEMD